MCHCQWSIDQFLLYFSFFSFKPGPVRLPCEPRRPHRPAGLREDLLPGAEGGHLSGGDGEGRGGVRIHGEGLKIDRAQGRFLVMVENSI